MDGEAIEYLGEE
jgi:hypothetical protein